MSKIIGITGIKKTHFNKYESVFIHKDQVHELKGCQLEFLVWTEAPTDEEYIILRVALKKGGYTNVRNQTDLRVLQESKIKKGDETI
jgi:hypothetical protein